MVVAMWREGNESSTRCIGAHGGGHVMEMEYCFVGNEGILYMVVAMQYKGRVCVIVILF